MALDPNDFEQLMNRARIKLAGSSDAGIRLELFETIKEFLEDSNAWTEDIEFQAQSGTQTYVLVPKLDGQIIRLIGVWNDQGVPVPAFMQDFTQVRLVNIPNTTPTAKWFARVVKNITLPNTKDDIPIVPDWVLRVYSVHVLDGLLGRMMGTPNTSYTDKTMSTYHLRRFRTGIQIARTAAIRQNTMGAQEWAYPRGWNSSHRTGVSTATAF